MRECERGGGLSNPGNDDDIKTLMIKNCFSNINWVSVLKIRKEPQKWSENQHLGHHHPSSGG
jgi:hypothetical protein